MNGDGKPHKEEPSRDDKPDVVQGKYKPTFVKPQSEPSEGGKADVVLNLQLKFDELNDLWSKAEKQLKRIPIPVDVSVRYKSVKASDDPEYDNGERIHSYLGFVKWSRQWRICYGEDHDRYPEMEVQWKPVADCSADIRIEAVPHLSKLREAVLAKASDCLGMLDTAIAKLSSTVADWKK
jgi:hypothetical protein